MQGDDDLLERAREELYHARVLARGLRNRATTDAAAFHDSELRLAGLIDELEARKRNGSYAKEAQGHEAQKDPGHPQAVE